MAVVAGAIRPLNLIAWPPPSKLVPLSRARRRHTGGVERSKPNPAVIAALLAGHVAVTALTWRDLRHRSGDQVRGSKKWWRVASAANTANSLVYWLIGRKKSPQGA
jgi:hypothetical protein